MININLLIKPPPLVRLRVVIQAAAAMLVLAILLLAGLSWYGRYRVAAAELEGHRLLLTTYRTELERAGAVEKEARAAEAALAALEALGESQWLGQSSLLREVLQPAPGVVITEVKIERGRHLRVSGHAESYAGAVAYLNRLRAIERLAALRADQLRADPSGLTSFRISAELRGRDEP